MAEIVDCFADGGRGDGDDPADVPWYRTVEGCTAEVASDWTLGSCLAVSLAEGTAAGAVIAPLGEMTTPDSEGRVQTRTVTGRRFGYR